MLDAADGMLEFVSFYAAAYTATFQSTAHSMRMNACTNLHT